ncbi:MAG: hypothetical protein A2653_02105 [Candidatus Zambryskibacteria bacterium RIFCSPHIGHO2_01_FULL_43_25]|uniref:Uncharacterized protein n=1 Tax=Candidatus Zambryskibacteria bacterium RIFCSPLOWO2_01_FULL_45_21 TaxID=1802761 RepID=A0A1G2U4H0_9BACT|nr:MAG: hypothetical protein A2653_02105 [Candidatus Zambryskibacteria bacterium RIFCSPHIGHO2_01_FULL_43_25]OHA99984.1 MAG: hypothetical protein A3E94_03150 [Candidatus Zambryskibacteria bacterium RIFCSPHIGHO2_12_FULL_44_12b]OHB03820.1 MAG: hypothetical protein A3B14_03965 [Candidatus Zambryskibacteria bacterium RIFCSPLOWO2_01_FULL_45_21]
MPPPHFEVCSHCGKHGFSALPDGNRVIPVVWSKEEALAWLESAEKKGVASLEFARQIRAEIVASSLSETLRNGDIEEALRASGVKLCIVRWQGRHHNGQ